MPKAEVVIFLVNDWDIFHRRPMLEAFARNAEGKASILALNPPISPLVAAAFRRDRLRRWLAKPGLRQLSSNLWLYTPFVWLHQSLSRRMGLLARWQRGYASQIARVMNRLGFGGARRVAWVFRPEQHQWLGLLREDFVLYECYDEYSLDYATGQSRPRSVRDEATLLSKADLVFTTSRSLYEARKDRHPQVHLVRNGANWELFHQATEDTTPIPPELEAIPRPIVGYAGNMSRYIDAELLIRLARQRPGWSFVLLGSVERGIPVGQLKALPNVYLLGRKPQVRLPRFSKGFDVSIIPLKVNEYLERSEPLTMWEQMATGTPVVVTRLREMSRLDDVLLTARGPEEWISRIEEALSQDQSVRIQKGIQAARERSWDRITERALGILLEALEDKPSVRV